MKKQQKRLGVVAIAVLGMSFAHSPVKAADVDANASADATVEATVVVPVSVSSASVTVRRTTVGPITHDGGTFATPAIAAGTEVSLVATVHGGAAADAQVSTSDSDTAVDLDSFDGDDGQRCLALGIDFDAIAGATGAADLSVSVDVLVDGEQAFGFVVADLDAHASVDAGNQSFPVETGAEVCLPEVEADPEAEGTVDAAADAVVGAVL